MSRQAACSTPVQASRGIREFLSQGANGHRHLAVFRHDEDRENPLLGESSFVEMIMEAIGKRGAHAMSTLMLILILLLLFGGGGGYYAFGPAGGIGIGGIILVVLVVMLVTGRL